MFFLFAFSQRVHAGALLFACSEVTTDNVVCAPHPTPPLQGDMGKVRKVLKLAGTRWLSMNQVLNRMLVDWEAYTTYFSEVFEGNDEAVERIRMRLVDPLVKLHVGFGV